MNGQSVYDALAPDYREYAERKSAYLSAVDRFVLGHIPSGAESLLDVGAGDGVRGMALARQLRINYTVLCDSSAKMAVLCRRQNPNEVWETRAEDLPDTGKRFDVIICLWNLLGHLPTRAGRVKALRSMRNLLKDRGKIFFDVNNRHNAASYGWLRVFGRILVDAVHFDERRGNATFDWKIGDKTYPGMGHLFTPREIESIIKESGLLILERRSIDYVTGAVSDSLLKGQLVYLVVPQ